MQEIFGQMMRLPATFFNSGIGLFTQTIGGIQRLTSPAGEGIKRAILPVTGSTSAFRAEARGEGNRGDVTDWADRRGPIRRKDTQMKDKDGDREETDCGRSYRTKYTDRDSLAGRDRDLGGKDLKLVRYKILFVKRDYEVAFPEHEELVADDLSDTDFTAWKIAEFTAQLKEEKVPKRWRDKNYPRDFTGEDTAYVDRLDENDKKYLRVYFEVLDRYKREEFHHEEREVGVLEEIRDAIRSRP